jgi:hypothetical protein
MDLRTTHAAGPRPSWSAEDLRHALLRRSNFRTAGRRRRRTGEGLAHAGVSRRAIRRLAERAAAALLRSRRQEYAAEVVLELSRGPYHDEQILALEILDELSEVWPAWGADHVTILSRTLEHPWVADRLASIQGKLLTRMPILLSKHVQWAISQNPLRRRAAAMALLPRQGRPRQSRGVPITRAKPILRLLLQDPETHHWVQHAVGQVLIRFAERAPRTVARLLRDSRVNLHPRHLEQAKRLVEALPSAS